MIRIRGFARKTRRPTKGGSLPASAVQTCHPNGNSDGDHRPDINMGNNGHHNGNGNGNGTDTIHRNGNGDLTPTARARSGPELATNGDRNGSDLSHYLHDVVEQLVDAKAPIEGRPPLDDLGPHSSVNGTSSSHLETVFARALGPLDSAASSPLWKRTFDITCIILTLPVWLPLLLLVMAWIKLVSPGPIFYRQERVGYRGRCFMIFKFRTMHANAETRRHEEYFAHLMNADVPMTKLDALDDNRLIRCGRFLRASGLDELPQLFNVLRADMSLVGPRPCLPNEFEHYTASQRMRVNALPGLTGYWQVNGKNKTTFSEMIAMDIFYSENMSVWLDLSIIAKTIPALVAETLEARGLRAAEEATSEASAPSLNGSATKI